MSRLGKIPILLPNGVSATTKRRVLTVKGPKGEIERELHQKISFSVKDSAILLTPRDYSDETRALWGTWHAHVINMVRGVSEGFKKVLQIEGVGYRAQLKGKDLELSLGFSHPVPVKAPEGITFAVEKNTVTISGASIEEVGNTAAAIRALKKPEPYKGKGIRYEGEIIRRKAGKKAVGSSG